MSTDTTVKANATPTYSEAFQSGVREEMTRNKGIFILGTDLQERGGHFAQVKGIAQEFDSETPDLKVFLFLIGVQELGQGPQKFSKRQKEELMHIANCRLFSELGFYELEGLDQDGWPHWKLVKPVPAYTLLEQELVLKSLIVTYFENQ